MPVVTTEAWSPNHPRLTSLLREKVGGMAKNENEATQAPTSQSPSNTITLDRDSLKALLAEATGMAMAASQQHQAIDYDAMGLALAQGIASQTRKFVSFGEYIIRPHSPFHPDGPSKVMTRQYYQNGVRLLDHTIHDKEIVLLNQITHSGRYCGRMVEVIVKDDGGDGEIIDIRFSNKTADQRLELRGQVRDFEDMLKQIIEAQKEERAEAEARDERAAVRRKFGSSKNTLAAEAAARG